VSKKLKLGLWDEDRPPPWWMLGCAVDTYIHTERTAADRQGRDLLITGQDCHRRRQMYPFAIMVLLSRGVVAVALFAKRRVCGAWPDANR